MDELAICAIFKNEAPYLHEWLSYHYAQGVRRFVLYDNASTDDSRAVIEGWARRDAVTVVDWPQQGAQLRAYADMVMRFRGIAEWCAFIDCDEFLCPQDALSLIDVLRQVGQHANGLYVHWWMFGSSGHVTRQPGLVTETFRWRAPESFGSHFFGKSVMRLSGLTHVGLHVFRCHGRMVNDAGWEIDQQSAGGQARQSHRLLALNHYFTKSREEWCERRALGKADKAATEADFRRALHEFAQHDINAVQDDRAALFMQAARALFYQAPPPREIVLPSPAHLLTVHGTLLCWDAGSARVVHCPPEQVSATRFLLACELAGTGTLHCRLLPPAPGNAASIDGAAEFAATPAGIGPALHLGASGVFLCAEAGSDTVRANRQEPREWETFMALAPDDVARIRLGGPHAARLLPGFFLRLGDADLYDLRWSMPSARLAALASAPPASEASLTMYDLSDESGPAPPPTIPEWPIVGRTLAELRAGNRVQAAQVFSAAAQRSRAAPFLALPAANPAAPYARLFADPAYRSYEVPELACCLLPRACILGGDGLLWFDGALLRDSVQSLEPWRPASLLAEAPAPGASVLRLKRPVPMPPPTGGALFCGFVGAWRNYAHWLTECLPRLFLYRELRARVPGLRLVLPPLPADSAQAQCLALLGIAATEIVTLADGEPLVGPIWAAPGIDPWAVPDVCRQAAAALVAAVVGSGLAGHSAPGARIYIRRGTETRRMTDLPALLPILEREGFRVVTMQEMTLAHQILTMQGARLIVGENGAALANIMFCRPGARVLELFNEAWANPAHWTLASLCGLDYGYLEGSHVPSSLAPLPSHNADYLVTPDQLRAGLVALLGSSG